MVKAAGRALAGLLVLSVVQVLFGLAAYLRMPWHPEVAHPMIYAGALYSPPAEPWWSPFVPVVGSVLILALALVIYRGAPRAVDRHLLIRRTTPSSTF
jgi:hypothetical protein